MTEISRYEALLMTIPAMPYDKDKIITSGDQDKLGASVARILDEKNNLDRMMNMYIDKKNRIIRQIESMKDPQYLKILSLRYVKFNELYKLVNVVGYSYTQVKNIHRAALKEFERIYYDEYKNMKSVSEIEPD